MFCLEMISFGYENKQFQKWISVTTHYIIWRHKIIPLPLQRRYDVKKYTDMLEGFLIVAIEVLNLWHVYDVINYMY